MTAPAKIAFLHIPKTGGVSVDTCLDQMLPPLGFRIHAVPDIESNRIPGKPGVRNFFKEEMLEIAGNSGPLQYVKNHLSQIGGM